MTVTIKNTNERYGDTVEFTGESIPDAVEKMQAAIRGCGDDFSSVVVTPDDYRIVMGKAAFLDDYLVAADFLDDHQHHVVAEALRDMAVRVMHMFTGSQMHSGKQLELQKLYSKDGWTYASDGRIAIRVRCKRELDIAPGNAGDTLSSKFDELWHCSSPDDFDTYVWEPIQLGTKLEREDDIGFYYDIGGRFIYESLAERIMMLPEPEYLDDIADYIFGSSNVPPLRFRFRCGEGVCMPLSMD